MPHVGEMSEVGMHVMYTPMDTFYRLMGQVGARDKGLRILQNNYSVE